MGNLKNKEDFSFSWDILGNGAYCTLVSSQNMYLNDLNSDAKFYFHSFNSFKMMVQNMVIFVPNVMELNLKLQNRR